MPRFLMLVVPFFALVLFACPGPGLGGGSADDDDSTSSPECVQDHAGHAACQETFGDLFFCGLDGACVEASGCEAEGCCLPGAGGDQWCSSTFGSCSVCVATTDGACSPQEC